MATMTLNPAALDAARRLVAIARARSPVAEAWLYGSHARGDAHEDSDVDVALVMDADDVEVRRVGRTLAGESAEVLLDTGKVVTPLIITAAAWSRPETSLNPSLFSDIRSDGYALWTRVLRRGRLPFGSRKQIV